jgi:hypothetical protein
MSDDTLLRFGFPAAGGKKVTAAFDGGRMTSDGAVPLLAAAERQLEIACAYEDADDLDHLRGGPGFKLACGRLPDSGAELRSQPTVSRWA